VSYRYSGVPNEKPVLERWPIHAPEDWAKIGEQPHDQGALGEQLEAVKLLRAKLPADVPMIETVFTPLAILGEMTRATTDLRAHLDSHPELVRRALEAVTNTTSATFARCSPPAPMASISPRPTGRAACS
jgi:uroporphyrinogen decarboxylase